MKIKPSISLKNFILFFIVLCTILIYFVEKNKKAQRLDVLRSFFEKVCKSQTVYKKNISFKEFLESDDLFGYEGSIDNDVLLSLKEMQNLTSLNLKNSQILNIDLSFLSELKNLESLNLSYSSITSKVLLQVSKIRSLKSLNLSHSNIIYTYADTKENDKTNIISPTISYLGKLKYLTCLDLSYSDILFFGGLGKVRSLTHLDLKGTEIESYDFTYIVESLKNLKEINIVETEIECNDVIDFRKKYPSLKIYVTDHDHLPHRHRMNHLQEGE